MPEREAKLVRDYMNMDNLSSNADETIRQYLSEIKSKVPTSKTVSKERLQNKVAKIVTNKNEIKINDIILKERDGIKKYVSAIRDNTSPQLASHVSKVVYSYLSEKIKA